MFPLVRGLTWASLFVGFLLVFLPARVLERSGLSRPAHLGVPQLTGTAIVVLGSVLAIWCILTFAFAGRGTPAPFDPPRKLVVSGPYRFVRNPMYLGADLALAGAALFYQSGALLVYAILFALATGLFAVLYEEPALVRTFGAEYEAYRGRVGRWLPRW